MKTSLAVIVGAAFILTGCAGSRKSMSSYHATSLGVQLNYYYTKDTKPLAGQIFFRDAYNAQDGNPAAQRVVRDRIVYELKGLIDDEFFEFCTRLRADKSWKNITATVLSIGLTGAIPFSSPTSQKALAGIDTGMKGISASVDLNAWNNFAPELLINTMKANRSFIAAGINVSIHDKDISQYTLEQALTELVAYRSEGFVTAALVSLAKTSAQQANENAKIETTSKVDSDAAKASLRSK